MQSKRKPREDWVLVVDDDRCLGTCKLDEWDCVSLLSLTSNDPRHVPEVENAWAHYRSQKPWRSLGWQKDLREVSANSIRLWLDLSNQRFYFRDANLRKNANMLRSGWLKSLDETNSDNVERCWLNIPDWWSHVTRSQWQSQIQATIDSHWFVSPGGLPRLHKPDPLAELDFRAVLYGKELDETLARSVFQSRPIRIAGSRENYYYSSATSADNALSRSSVTGLGHGKNGDAESEEIRRIHAAWLMTPRPSLRGERPRTFLHRHRNWKERELEYRRHYWSMTRTSPYPVSTDSHLYRMGPMGTVEVTSYFYLCRDLIEYLWRYMLDTPDATLDSLVEHAHAMKDQLLQNPYEPDGTTTFESAMQFDRSLMPLLATSAMIDCDCPLCRLQSTQADLFGPTFLHCDAFELEMEQQFAFSLCESRREWKELCDDMGFDIDEFSQAGLNSTSDRGKKKLRRKKQLAAKNALTRQRKAKNKSSLTKTTRRKELRRELLADGPHQHRILGQGEGREAVTPSVAVRAVADSHGKAPSLEDDDAALTEELRSTSDLLKESLWAGEHWSDIFGKTRLSAMDKGWKKGWIKPSAEYPQLSLFCIGAQLATVIAVLLDSGDQQACVSALNSGFDELMSAVRQWLVSRQEKDEAAANPSIQHAIDCMCDALRMVQAQHAELEEPCQELTHLLRDWHQQLVA